MAMTRICQGMSMGDAELFGIRESIRWNMVHCPTVQLLQPVEES
jgi:hypothetical protein